MGIFDKLFGGAREPVKPDDYYLESSISSLIAAFISSEGLEDFINGGWYIVLSKDYRVSMNRTGRREGSRAAVRLDELEEMAYFKRVMTDSVAGDIPLLVHMTIDKLADAVLHKMKGQLGG